MVTEGVLGGDGSVTITFRALPMKARVARYFRGLMRPVVLAIFAAFLFGVPGAMYALDEAPWRLFHFGIVLGGGAAALVFVTSLLAVVLQRMPETTYTFDDDGILEETGGARTERSWSWLTRVVEDAHTIELHLQQGPLKTGRLAPTRAGVLVLYKFELFDPVVARLSHLLAAHVRG